MSHFRPDYHESIDTYKAEIADLTKEITTLRKAAAASAKITNTSRSFGSSADSSGAGPADAARVAELEAEVARLEGENLVLSSQVEGVKERADAEVVRMAEERDARWKAKVAEALAKAEVANAKEVQQLRRERESSFLFQ